MAIDLTVASLDELHHHRREKWSMQPPDVLSSTIAEMDFPIAEPVTQARREAIDRKLDCSGLGFGLGDGDEPADVFLRRGRVALSPGLAYGPEGARHVRLNFATSPPHLDDALTRMQAALHTTD